MANRMQPLHFEVLDEKRIKAFKDISAILDEKYYLAGGTALALQLGHRKSYDFDVFGNKDITFAVKKKIIKGLSGYKIKTLVDSSDELSLILNEEIKLTVLNYYWDPIKSLVKLKGYLPLLSILDIAATKAYALGRRGNYRDYFDLYIIIKNEYATLRAIISCCKKKYGELFSEKMLLEQLTYIGDLDEKEKLMFSSEKFVPSRKIIEFFKNKIKGNSH
ncbi:nucleotidyl transferase AbiEii/AbiGii toxin family protein [Candidatus Saganbacteria bacterium]|nr:nucleotidyl transferase AbiEii/AbiGii toxin family protein [Candidatus Saganbacteria bacterium]